jgi:hypothetical protein
MPLSQDPDTAFEAPGRTLFLWGSEHLRVLTFDDGQEVSLPTPDFLDLLLHLKLHQAAALAVLQISRDLLDRLLGGLAALADDKHG